MKCLVRLLWIVLVCVASKPAESRSASEPYSSGTSATAEDMMCKVQEPGAEELANDQTIRRSSERLSINSDDDDAREKRASRYAQIGAYAAALADYNARIARGNAGAEIYNDRCFVRTLLDQLPDAIEDCDESLRQNPAFDEAFDTRGVAKLKAGDPVGAIHDFNAALRLNPKMATSLYARGIAKLQIGAAADAETDFRKAVALKYFVGNQVASYGLPDPHPEAGLRGFVRIDHAGTISIVNSFELPDGHIADAWTQYRPGDPLYLEVLRHLCGLKPGEHRGYRPW